MEPIFRYFLWTGKLVFLLILLDLIMKKRDRPWQRRHCRRDIAAFVCLQGIQIIPVKKISAGASWPEWKVLPARWSRSGRTHFENTRISCRYLTGRCHRRFLYPIMDLRKALRICVPPFMEKKKARQIFIRSHHYLPFRKMTLLNMKWITVSWEKGRRKCWSKRQKRPEGKKRQQKSIQRKKAQQKKKDCGGECQKAVSQRTMWTGWWWGMDSRTGLRTSGNRKAPSL